MFIHNTGCIPLSNYNVVQMGINPWPQAVLKAPPPPPPPPRQAAELTKAQYDEDWKLITVLIGGNNLCIVCEAGKEAVNSDVPFEQHMYVSWSGVLLSEQRCGQIPVSSCWWYRYSVMIRAI
jgi:hypothetical protein